MEFLRLLEGMRSPFLDSVIGLLTRLGEETVAIVILCAIFWCISKRVAYVIGTSFFLSGLTVQGMKICFRIDRPWVADPTLKPVESAYEHATGYSFPSGHTQSATALFGSLGMQIKQRAAQIVCFIIPVIVAFSRLYLGVHTPQDVLVSLVITFLFVLLTLKIMSGDASNKKHNLIISLVMVVYAGVVILIAMILHSNGTIEEKYVADCMKAAGAGVGFAVGMFVERTYIDFPVKSRGIIWQIIKYVIGLAILLGIQEGLKPVIGKSLIADMCRYFLMISWVTLFYPLLIKKFFKPVDKQSEDKDPTF